MEKTDKTSLRLFLVDGFKNYQHKILNFQLLVNKTLLLITIMFHSLIRLDPNVNASVDLQKKMMIIPSLKQVTLLVI